ncbi:MAG: hypothetical protein ACJ8HJ_05360 [Massilia sp.]
MRHARHALGVFVIAVSAAAPVAAVAADDWLGGFVMGDHVDTTPRTDAVNRDNFLGIADRSSSVALLLEGAFQGTTFRVRSQVSDTSGAQPATKKKVVLQELARTFQLDENVTLSVGKRLFSLDQSYVGQPLGFFQKQVDLSDPTDSAGRAEGLPMAVLSWANETTSLTGIYSDDFGVAPDGYNRGIRQWLVRYGYEMPNASLSLVVRRASSESLGFGGTFSATLADYASVYGSFYTARGTARPVLAQSIVDHPRVATNPSTLVGSFRADDDVAYPRAAVGFIVTPRDLPKLQVEYIHDRRGQSDAQFGKTIGLLHYLDSQPGPVGLVGANKAAIASILQTRGARRRYLSVNVDHTIDAFSAGAGVYASLADRSGTAYASAGYLIGSHTSLSLSAVRMYGRHDTEFALSPVASVVSVRLKYTF